ncbi:hypothetical protein VTL71DRAFT_7195 [Oculimacula yallundae]|uniref:Uncharacterized protein n=1 Tax=Oculimacula yallundae TaxID=86028 RepID=A0ABR4BWU2_9HELO
MPAVEGFPASTNRIPQYAVYFSLSPYVLAIYLSIHRPLMKRSHSPQPENQNPAMPCKTAFGNPNRARSLRSSKLVEVRLPVPARNTSARCMMKANELLCKTFREKPNPKEDEERKVLRKFGEMPFLVYDFCMLNRAIVVVVIVIVNSFR